MEELSVAAKSLWAKKSKNSTLLWVPLWVHLEDSAFIAKKLWNNWVSDGVKDAINREIEEGADGEKLFVFLAAAHDIGKATPVFQARNSTFPPCELDFLIYEKIIGAGLPIEPEKNFTFAQKTPHALMGQLLLKREGCDKTISVIIGSHHGKPPSSQMLLEGIEAYPKNYYMGTEGKVPWTKLQNELIRYSLALADFESMKEIPKPNMVSQVLLSGLLVMADWIASNEYFFPYFDAYEMPRDNFNLNRQKTAWKKIDFPSIWSAGNEWMQEDLISKRFSFPSNHIQKAVYQVVSEAYEPGIFVLEASMGSGKTEAALIAAEILANKTKRSGIFFALPTQATSDGIFPRIINWIEKLNDGEAHSIELAHGKAQFNEDMQTLKFLTGSKSIGEDEENSAAIVHGWFEGQKKALLADFVVGTIDQLLMGALKQKHVMLRHLGLANKVVIIDECHAYDSYMGRYLDMILRWLGAYHVPVIVLSATLPSQIRCNVINSYMNTRLNEESLFLKTSEIKKDDVKKNSRWKSSCDYPLLTWSDGVYVKQKAIKSNEGSREVMVSYTFDEDVVANLKDALVEGGCVGVIVNTVKRAQHFANLLRNEFEPDSIRLLHSRFLAPDRIRKEKELLGELGKLGETTERPFLRIVVGTQVLEQSLDIDFDVMFTDICPMDLLLQRIGRLHRHNRTRPVKLERAVCHIMGINDDCFDKGAEKIYGAYLLKRTKALIPRFITLPSDIPELVQCTYDNQKFVPCENLDNEELYNKWQKKINDKEVRAEAFRVSQPWMGSETIMNWLNTDVMDKHGEAAVRDTDESIEVILIQEKENKLFLMSGEKRGVTLKANEIPDENLAKAIVRQRVRLPSELCKPWTIKETIDTLESITIKRLGIWQKSTWIKGELFLILDRDSGVEICGYLLKYNQWEGLSIEKEGKANE